MATLARGVPTGATMEVRAFSPSGEKHSVSASLDTPENFAKNVSCSIDFWCFDLSLFVISGR